MKASFSSLLLAGLLAGVFCSKECITPPKNQYKGCSNQVGSYVLKTVNKYCTGDGPWSTAAKFEAAIKCFTDNGLDLEGKVCKKTRFGAVDCPWWSGFMASTFARFGSVGLFYCGLHKAESEALTDCTQEITRNDKGTPHVDGYNAACPTNTDENAVFLQYHMNCCLINHSLEFSILTYTEALAVHKKCAAA